MFNKRISSMLCILAVMAICVSVAGAAETIEKKKLKIFILAGQSNMEGHAKIETFDYIGDDPKTAPLLKEMRGPDGKPKICERVWISYLTGSGGNSGEGFGKLTAGYGSRRNPKENGGKIGPEFTFGITMEKACDGPILIIKTAWGGKSLHTDFRPPSAGPFELSETDMANIKKRGGDVNAEQAKRKQQSGHYYRLMMDHVNHVLKDIKRVCPVYDEQAGYEIAGFAWFQGWNDLVNRGVYPNRDKKGGYDLYSELMAKFIRDVRKDLKTPGMPFVIGVIGVNGPIENVDERYRAIHGNLREAMAAPAELDEFKGNVLAVRTAPFWDMPIDRAMVKRDHYNGQVNQLKKKAKNGEWTAAKLAAELKKIEGQSPTDKELAIIKRGASNAGYHYLGCGKTMALIGKAFAEGLISMKAQSITIQKGNVFGYTSVGKDRVDESYNAGFSMYAAAWPLMKEYPGHSFQSGLFGTWMFAQNDKPVPADVKLYSDIEGGLGWWRDTEYPTETPKFIMGGVELNFRGWANGPGAGQGRNWNNPKGKYGIAQLSPWVLWPPDGLNLKQGTCGELFGYGYLPLPLTEAKTTTAGKNVLTGDRSWTLFLNTNNFKGPVAFFTPYFWARASVEDPRLSGMFLDSRPSQANKPYSMETQNIRCAQATDSKGQTYARIAPTQFPVGPQGDSVILHRLMVYNNKAIWDGVKRWFEGGDPVDGAIDPEGACEQKFDGRGGPGWRIEMPNVPKEQRASMETNFMNARASGADTFKFNWTSDLATRTKTKEGSLVTMPQYYHLLKGEGGKKDRWVAVAANEVPAETGLAKVSFSRPEERPPLTYITPEAPEGCWKKPGPAAGPFKVKVGDGSTVTYYWYRFADQPALLNADMTDKEREALQKRVEKLHRHWTKDRNYLAPPRTGKLAEIDPVLIVTPPAGMEVGYVPIVTRQGIEK